MPAAVDLPRGANLWTEVERTLYNQLPIYLNKRSVEYNQYFDRWTKLLKPQTWTPNMGNVMRGVNKVPSAITRGQALPNPITQVPLKDIIEVRETREDTQLYRQDFDSNIFHFLPSFQDFLTDHVDATNKDMAEKIQVYKDLFYRTAIFHGAPYVWVCGKTVELTEAPHWAAPTIALSKPKAFLSQMCQLATKTLDYKNMMKLSSVMAYDLNVPFYTGKTLPDGTDGAALKGKYCCFMGGEVWDNMAVNDTFLLANKDHNRDIITAPFTGSIGGKWTTLHERFEIRIDADGDIVGPETTEENVNAHNYGDTVMSQAYIDAPFAVAFGVGYEGWKAVKVGAPPNLFAGDLNIKQFAGMDWNGKIHMTRDILVAAGVDQNGAAVLDTNKRGEYLQLISDVVLGISPIRRRNIIPIIYKRERINANS